MLKLLFSRVPFVVLVVAIQVAGIAVMFWVFSEYVMWFYAASSLLSIVLVLYIANSNGNPSFKVFWLVVIFLVPIVGMILYLMMQGTSIKKKSKTLSGHMMRKIERYLEQDEAVLKRLKKESSVAAGQVQYLRSKAAAPVYDGTKVEYLASGEEYFARMIREMKKAEKFIFMEYFTISQGELWDEILEILKEKVGAGVEVRIMYDDLGCLKTLPFGYVKRLRRMGIRAVAFNPLMSVVAARFNHRDHRKITVIDGRVGFTGGANIGDEYVNVVEKFGHWKDAGVVIQGDAVWSLTVMFLALWDTVSGGRSDDLKYQSEAMESDGYVAPFASAPTRDYSVAPTVYLNMITKATEEVFITTPYLILDDGFVMALRNAAESGVDVRIIVPGVPDKKVVNMATKAHYKYLLESGVKIYEYNGFMHAKTLVVDGEFAVVGTVNLDYRSLYLHFECGVYLYGCGAIRDLRKDFLDSVGESKEITRLVYGRASLIVRMNRAIVRAFSALM